LLRDRGRRHECRFEFVPERADLPAQRERRGEALGRQKDVVDEAMPSAPTGNSFRPWSA
jgi:hypothetical protein